MDTTPTKRLVVSCCDMGLGNRLKVLTSSARIARKLGHEHQVIWPVDNYHCSCPYDRLFETPKTFADESLWRNGSIPSGRSVRLVREPDFRIVEQYGVGHEPNVIDTANPCSNIYIEEYNFVYMTGDTSLTWGQHSLWGPPKILRPWCLGDICEQQLLFTRDKHPFYRNFPKRASLPPNRPVWKDEILAEFDALRPVAYVRDEVDRFFNTRLQTRNPHSGFPTLLIGCHIRREDNTWSLKHCSDEEFAWEIQEFLRPFPDARIFLATDGVESEEFIKKKFPGHVVTYPVRSLARGASWQAVQDALIIMLLLARCDVLVRSSSSTFSQCAAWFGRIPTREVGGLEHSW